MEVLEIPVTFDTLFEQNGKRINCTVGEYFKQIIERLEKVEKYSSASKHKVTLVLVSQFRSVNMRFDELDLTYLREFEIFLSQKGNVNNSCNYAAFQYCRLYLIEILHQTTTHCKCIQFTLCCILSKFYIKPQHPSKVFARYQSCILSKFYIKPQLYRHCDHYELCCILSKFYIKPQRVQASCLIPRGCILSKFYIKPQPPEVADAPGLLYLIEILHQTTTFGDALKSAGRLYLIEILHQTTTNCTFVVPVHCCILSKFYIKPQLIIIFVVKLLCCILSKFYIKPQQQQVKNEVEMVVSYRNSTSNHNLGAGLLRLVAVVSYRNSTSNHNVGPHID